jgi:IS5 family transposase
MHRARERLVRLAQARGIKLRQSYPRVGKFALIRHQRYAHAKQVQAREQCFAQDQNPAGPISGARSPTTPPSMTPSPCRCRWPIRFATSANGSAARRSTRCMRQRCKGKAHKPSEFGVKVSVATPVNRCKGGQFVLHAKALPGNPYDGHTLAVVIPEIEASVGASLTKIVADAGYRGHNASKEMAGASSSISRGSARRRSQPRRSSASMSRSPSNARSTGLRPRGACACARSVAAPW